MPPELRVVLLTTPNSDVAVRLARTLVEEGLVACVNVVPGVRSIYRWEGAIHEDAEVLLIAKTRADRCDDVATRVRELHPYALPEVLTLDVSGGSAPYLAWLTSEAAR